MAKLPPTQRRILWGVIVFFLITACNQVVNNNSATNLAPETVSSAECRIIQHAMGETCVPRHPQRVVTLIFADPGNALALGIQPIGGLYPEHTDNPYLQGKFTEIKNVGIDGEPSLEAILALKPDLILASYPYHQQIYSQLQQIAPTVLVEAQGSKDWKKVLMKQAEALGKLNEAEKLMTDYYARLEKFKAEMGANAASPEENRLNQIEVSVVRPYQTGEFLLYSTNTFAGGILQDADLRRPTKQDQHPLTAHLSRESIPDLDADVIFIWTWGYTPAFAQDAEKLLASLNQDPLWLQLNAVKKGKVYRVPGYWIGSSIQDANAVIDDLFKYLVEKW
ncbi:MAG: iron-siderophore ABC transporter substrate-binding protein [Nodularia sp. CChRGM 3473]